MSYKEAVKKFREECFWFNFLWEETGETAESAKNAEWRQVDYWEITNALANKED